MKESDLTKTIHVDEIFLHCTMPESVIDNIHNEYGKYLDIKEFPESALTMFLMKYGEYLWNISHSQEETKEINRGGYQGKINPDNRLNDEDIIWAQEEMKRQRKEIIDKIEKEKKRK